MSQSKLQVFIQEATPILESYLNNLLGQEVSIQAAEAVQAALEQLQTEATTSFSIVGRPENLDAFVVQMDTNWIPVISNAMLGREMAPDEEGVFDLTGQIISQAYAALQESYPGFDQAPAMEATPFAPDTWEPDENLPANYWQLAIEVDVDGQKLSGNIYVSQTWVDSLDIDTSNSTQDNSVQNNIVQDNAGQDAVDVSSPKFPDFGRESLQSEGPGNFELLAEVELNVTVELGRRKIPLSEVLKLTTGSVIELEKLVGEPLEIFANGRLIAEGEAVVIEEQFGVRITNLASSKQYAKALA